MTRAGRLFGFLPPNVLTAKQLACDPVPPPTRVSEYDPAFFEGAEDPLAVRPGRNRRENARMLERLVPDPVFRRQLEDFFTANPQFAQRFPGGVVEFAQVAAQMPEEVLEDLMIEVANANAAQQQGAGAFPAAQQPGHMPGQMPGFGGLDDDDLPDLPPGDPEEGEENVDEEEEEEEVEAAVRILPYLAVTFADKNL